VSVPLVMTRSQTACVRCTYAVVYHPKVLPQAMANTFSNTAAVCFQSTRYDLSIVLQHSGTPLVAVSSHHWVAVKAVVWLLSKALLER
jgi:hypothetical protein